MKSTLLTIWFTALACLMIYSFSTPSWQDEQDAKAARHKRPAPTRQITVVNQYASIDPAMLEAACSMYPKQIRKTIKDCQP